MMKINAAVVLTGAAVFAASAVAQHAGHQQSQNSQPYAELMARPIKALSSYQLADLKSGQGMGLSLPAELNGYPGPKHVLELAGQLGLDAAQREVAARLIASMQSEAVATGTTLIELERRLEALFADQSPKSTDVQNLTEQIGAAQSRLRSIHLEAHLRMRDALSPEQIRRYAILRGYVSNKP
jgi:Spy/CpxP family protein refolding chaperone